MLGEAEIVEVVCGLPSVMKSSNLAPVALATCCQVPFGPTSFGYWPKSRDLDAEIS